MKRENILTEKNATLMAAAEQARSLSRSPYSEIKVGAAALLSSGETITGANWESPSYPAGICAERSMLSNVFSHGTECVIEAVAIAAERKGGENMDISPCGICRQSLLDAEKSQGKSINVIFRHNGEYIITDSAAELLPFAFDEI